MKITKETRKGTIISLDTSPMAFNFFESKNLKSLKPGKKVVISYSQTFEIAGVGYGECHYKNDLVIWGYLNGEKKVSFFHPNSLFPANQKNTGREIKERL